MNKANAADTGTTVKGGRPIGFDRGAAIEAAMELFWRRGYAAVTASELADAMGIRRSSFYNTFGTREAVFLEAMSHYAGSAPDRLLDAIGDTQPILPTVVAVFRDLCRVRAKDAEGRGCMVCNVTSEVVGVDETLGPALGSAIEARIRSFERLFARAVESGELPRSTDVAAMGKAFTAFLIGLNTMSKVVRSERQLWGAARQFLASQGLSV